MGTADHGRPATSLIECQGQAFVEKDDDLMSLHCVCRVVYGQGQYTCGAPYNVNQNTSVETLCKAYQSGNRTSTHCIGKRLNKRPRVILEVYVCLALASWEEMAPSQRRLSQRTCNVVMSAMVSRKASHVPVFALLPKIRAFSRGSGLELKVVSQVLVEG